MSYITDYADILCMYVRSLEILFGTLMAWLSQFFTGSSAWPGPQELIATYFVYLCDLTVQRAIRETPAERQPKIAVAAGNFSPEKLQPQSPLKTKSQFSNIRRAKHISFFMMEIIKLNENVSKKTKTKTDCIQLRWTNLLFELCFILYIHIYNFFFNFETFPCPANQVCLFL